MSQPDPSPPAFQPMIGKKYALGLGAGLLLGFAGMLTFTAIETSRRETIETVVEPSAVGDDHFFPLTDRLQPEQLLATFGGGRKLFAAKTELVEHRDTRMIKVSLDDTGAFYVYRSTEKAEEPFHFLKTAHREYIKAVAK